MAELHLARLKKNWKSDSWLVFYSNELERYNPLPNYNIAPTHLHPVITNEDVRHFQLFRWGLIPFWANDISIGSKMINARLENNN